MVDQKTTGLQQSADLRASEALYRSLVESVPDFILLLDLDGTIRYINRPVPRVDQSTFVGSSAFDYVADESEGPMRAAMEGRCSSLEARTGE